MVSGLVYIFTLVQCVLCLSQLIIRIRNYMFFYINYCLEEQHFYNIKHFFLLFFWQMNETENATHPRFKSHNTLLVHAPNPCRIPSSFIGQITRLYTHQYTHSRTHTHIHNILSQECSMICFMYAWNGRNILC